MPFLKCPLKIKVKVLEIKVSEQKIRVGLRQTQQDPFDFFKDKKKGSTITVKVVKTDNKALTVRPEGCEMDFQIKKSKGIRKMNFRIMSQCCNIWSLGHAQSMPK